MRHPSEEVERAYDAIREVVETGDIHWSIADPFSHGTSVFDSGALPDYKRSVAKLLRHSKLFSDMALSYVLHPSRVSRTCEYEPFVGHKWDALAAAMSLYIHEQMQPKRK